MSYSPTVGRFLQRDPEGYVDGGNLYLYVRGTPLSSVDPQGTIAWAVVGCIGGLVAPPGACTIACAQNPKWGTATTFSQCFKQCMNTVYSTPGAVPVTIIGLLSCKKALPCK